jgi:hypothetical protein
MVRGAGCREINPRLRRREKNVLDIPLYRSGVAVEKVHFLQNSEKLGDRECIGKWRTSFVGHPDAILFFANFAGRSSSTAEGPAGGRGKAERNLS